MSRFEKDLIALKLKCGTLAKVGDVIRWNCFDSEEYTDWSLTGLYTGGSVTYLGGGIDFGMGIGNKLTIQDVIDEANANDEDERGVEKIGVSVDVARCIAQLAKTGE